MEPEQERHLTGPDCELFLRDSGRSDPRCEEWDRHLRVCGPCAALMESFKREETRLKGLRAPAGARPGEHCPDSQRWLRLAAGLEDGEEAAFLLDHAAVCDVCGAYLKIATEDLHWEETPEPGSGVADQSTAGTERNRRLAAEMARQQAGGQRAPAGRKSPQYWILAFAAAAGLMAVLFTVRPAWLFGPQPEELLARAYEADRTWPVRFPGAAFVPQVSSSRSASPRNTPLAEAEAIVSSYLDRDPENSRWRLLHGRAEFLHHDYDSAIELLQALANGPDPGPSLTDLGTAYLARGLAAGNATDEEAAVESLSKAIQRNPNDAVARYNRALALEALMLWDRAGEDWNEYLKLDPRGGWAEEAQKHLEAAAKKKVTGSAN